MRTIVHISDLHFGRLDDAVAAGLLVDVAATPVSLLVCSGDFTQRARGGQYRQAADFLAKLPRPQLVVPGNHDIPLWDFIRRTVAPLGRYKRYISNDFAPIYRDDEMFVMGLNTARRISLTLYGFWKDGRISNDQLRLIERTAAEVPGDLFKIVVTHHPFLPPPADPTKTIVHGATEALAVMERCGVDLLLAGHLHSGYSDDVRGRHLAVRRSILSIQAGTATSNRRRGEPNSYNRITLDRDHVQIDVRAWDGKAFVSSAVRDFRKIDESWVASTEPKTERQK
jgi:3',5'-cyclic AMP phosphodiesterase CpdA